MAFLLWNMFITESNTVACQFCQHNRPRPVPLTSFFSCNSCLKENSFCEYVQSKYCLLILLLTAIVTLLVLWNLLKRKNHEESSIVSEKEEDIIIEKLISKLKTRDEFIFKDNQSKYIKNCRMVCDDVPKADKQSFDLPQDDENSKKEDMKLAAELIETLEKETFQNSEVQDLDEKIKSIEATIKYMKSKMDSKGVGDDSIIELNKQKEIGEKFEDKKDKTTSTELNVISKTILADFEDNLNLSYNENTKISNIEKSDVDEIEYKDNFFERDLKTDLKRKIGDLKQKRKHKLEPNVAKSNTILLSKPKLYSETGKHFEEKKKEIPSTEQDIISQDIKANLEDKINSTYTENKVNNNLEKAVKEKVVNQKPNQSESLEKTKENSQNFQEDLKNMLDKYFSGQSSTLKIRKEKKYDEEKNNENYQVPYPGEEKND
ncbi:uncharacterized protein LOC103506385 [Diaphorina citri]|uniref:Uncharacterized protein LOC103506385 n=1 Tax=Diaphorina citri TaxID=121845 RepID=A0A1S4E7V1_DIACI|nr:uncharacterized protein LOC103506385 [Diaphorina citri]